MLSLCDENIFNYIEYYREISDRYEIDLIMTQERDNMASDSDDSDYDWRWRAEFLVSTIQNNIHKLHFIQSI